MADPVRALGAPAENEWEISDMELPPTRMRTDQVLSLACQGQLGFYSQSRLPDEAKGVRTAERPEFGHVFPHLNFAASPNRPKDVRIGLTGMQVHKAEISGIAAINPYLPSAIECAKEIAVDPKARDLGFWFSAYVAWAPFPVLRRTQIFDLWDGVFVAPIVESTSVLPGGILNVYLAVFNLTARPQHRSLSLAGWDLGDEARRSLTFSLPPWRWTVQRLAMPATDAPGGHALSFETRSGAQRAATAIATGVLTLGSFVAIPGSQGFALGYNILSPELAQVVSEWQARGLQDAARRFEAAHANAIADPTGVHIPRESILPRFELYLTPSLILSVLKDQEHSPADTMPVLFDEFLFEGYRIQGGAENAFVRA